MSINLIPSTFQQEYNEEIENVLLECNTNRLCVLYKKLKSKQRLCTQHIWFNSQCRKYNLFPNYIHFKCKSKSRSSKFALNAAKRIWLNEEIRNWYRIRDNVSEYLAVIHFELLDRLHSVEVDIFLSNIHEDINEMIHNVFSKQIKKLEKLWDNQNHSGIPKKFNRGHDSFVEQSNENGFVLNISQKILTKDENKLLMKGLNFSVSTPFVSKIDFVIPIESAANLLLPEQEQYYRGLIRHVLENNIKSKHNLSIEEHKALKSLQADESIIILPADKGKVTVILDKDDYNNKINTLITSGEYIELKKDPTKNVEKTIKSTLKMFETELEKNNMFKLSPQYSKPPHFYGLPKIHKDNIPLRPIVSSIDSPSYQLSKFLLPILTPLFGNSDSYLKNSEHFIERLKTVRIIHKDKLVSYDVSSLFTNVPVAESLKIIKNKLELENNLQIRTHLSVNCIMTLLETCVNNSYFEVEGKFYKQMSGLPMGGVLSPIISNIFMDHFEKTALENWEPKPKIWLRYIDDIFCVWEQDNNIEGLFLEYINRISPNIKFTMECEEDGQLPFLDIMIKKLEGGGIDTSVYHKKTFSGQYLNYLSNHPDHVKVGLVRSLFSKINKFSTSKEDFDREEKIATENLKMNNYPINIIKKAKFKKKNRKKLRNDSTQKPLTTVVIPYVKGTSEKIRKINSKFNIRTAFQTSNSLRSYLTKVKPKNINQDTKNSIYKIDCECNKTYFGQSSRPVKIRINEHIKNYKFEKIEKSKLVDHAIQEKHSIKFDSSKIVSKEASWRNRNLIESACMAIKKDNCISQPSLNFSSIFLPIIKDELLRKIENSKPCF